MKRLKQLIGNCLDILKLPALFAVLLGGSILLEKFGTPYYSGLGGNLIAEFVGAAVTVFGIDYLLRRREEKRRLPITASSYEDVRVMTHWALSLWKEAYVSSVGDSIPTSWNELLSEQSISKVLMSLDINKPANALPKQTWSAYFDHQMDKIHKHAEKVLERHNGVLEPEVHNAVYMLVYYKPHSIASLSALDQHMGTPRPSNLGGHFAYIREWFEAVLTLHEWTIRTHAYLRKHGIEKIHAPYSFPAFPVSDKPPASFDEGVFEEQVKAFAQWQESKKAEQKNV